MLPSQELKEIYRQAKIASERQNSTEEPEVIEEPWIDPAGGIHYGNEHDPSAMYE